MQFKLTGIPVLIVLGVMALVSGCRMFHFPPAPNGETARAPVELPVIYRTQGLNPRKRIETEPPGILTVKLRRNLLRKFTRPNLLPYFSV